MQHLTAQEIEVISDIKSALSNLLGDHAFRFILFGSKARGDFDANSDLDLAIIVDGLDRTLKRAIYDAIADVELKHLNPVSALVLSSDDFGGLVARERRIALDIMNEGVAL